MSSADLVQVKGLGSLFHSLIHLRMSPSSSVTLRLAPYTVHETISQRELDPLMCSPGSAGEELLVPNCNRDCNRVGTCKQPDQTDTQVTRGGAGGARTRDRQIMSPLL
jgi:hypothetical protein